ncbi:Hypothetical predicted protein [Olea europaea subsp. europaea]|uniref:Uncharacterized protein n=1 Tax=Olea europaea subsp. europaea TaxID=158383 RepID=A0A8S0QIG9_OLEEU|nr:Hypothetical predicted protein [Olea europaea subsp. europaea]
MAGKHPEHCLHTVPTNFLEMPGNQAMSLSQPGHVSDMSCILCPEVPKIILHPYHVPEMTCTSYPKNCLEMPGNQVASRTQSRSIPNMVRTSLSRSYLKIHENQDVSLPMRPEHGLHTVPKNCPEMPENQAPYLSWLGRVLDLAYTP